VRKSVDEEKGKICIIGFWRDMDAPWCEQAKLLRLQQISLETMFEKIVAAGK